MKRIYIITAAGRMWSQAGRDWIENVLKPDLGETDETCAFMGAAYNIPSLLLGELTERPDSFVILSWEHIDTICGEEVQEFCRRLRESTGGRDGKTSWQILRGYIGELAGEPAAA